MKTAWCVFALISFLFLIASADHDDTECVPSDNANGTMVRCDLQRGMCGGVNLTAITNPHWECFSFCALGLWNESIRYSFQSDQATLTSPLLCPTGTKLYQLSFIYLWMDSAPDGSYLAVVMETGEGERELWSTWSNDTAAGNINDTAAINISDTAAINISDTAAININVSSPDSSFRILFRASSPEVVIPVYIEAINLSYYMALPFTPPSTEKLFSTVVASVVVLCVLAVVAVVVSVVVWLRCRRVEENNSETDEGAMEGHTAPETSTAVSGGSVDTVHTNTSANGSFSPAALYATTIKPAAISTPTSTTTTTTTTISNNNNDQADNYLHPVSPGDPPSYTLLVDDDYDDVYDDTGERGSVRPESHLYENTTRKGEEEGEDGSSFGTPPPPLPRRY